MAKKRRFEQLQAAAASQEKKIYVNPLQKHVDERLMEVEKKLEGKGRLVMYVLIALVLIAAGAYGIFRFTQRTSGAAQTALGKAIETSDAQISDTGAPPGSTKPTFKTEKERSEAAIAQFQDVVDKFGGAAAEKAKYFIAVNKLQVDRPAAIQDLEAMSNGSSDVAKLAKFALAQTRVEDNRLDDALALYQELAGMDDPIIAKDTINFEIAKIYEKQGNKQEAVDIYFNIAKTASEAKDMDGKPVHLTQTASDAKDKVKQLDPEKAKEIPEATPDSPFGG